MHLSLHGWCTMPFRLEKEIPMVAKYGFEGIEMRYQKLDSYLKDHTPSDLKRLVKKNGIKVVSIGSYPLPVFCSDERIKEKFEQGLEIASKVSCSTVQIKAPIPPYEMDKNKAYHLAAHRLKTFARQARDLQIKLAIEPEGAHSFLPGPYEALKLIEIVNEPNFGLVIDTYLFYKSYVDSSSIDTIPLEKIFLVHVSDCEDQIRPLLTDWKRTYPGIEKEVVPLREWLSIVKHKGYEGYYSVEVFREDYWKEGLENVVKKTKEGFLQLWNQI